MDVSLDQAIDIHARALVSRRNRNAIQSARDYAEAAERSGDSEGCEVWIKVAMAAAALLLASPISSSD